MRHEHHADDAEEEQGVIFAALDAHAFDVTVGERDAEQAADEQQRVDEDREAVERDHAVEACDLAPICARVYPSVTARPNAESSAVMPLRVFGMKRSTSKSAHAHTARMATGRMVVRSD